MFETFGERSALRQFWKCHPVASCPSLSGETSNWVNIILGSTFDSGKFEGIGKA